MLERSPIAEQRRGVNQTIQFAELIADDPGASQRTYRVDAALLALPKRSAHPTPELERETHDILGRTVDDLKGHSFQVWRIDPVANPNGSIAYYDVYVKW